MDVWLDIAEVGGGTSWTTAIRAGHRSLLAVGTESPSGLYLHTALDLPRIEPFLTAPGQYDLEYAVLASDFPVLRFTVGVTFTGDPQTTQAALRRSSD